MLTLSGDIMPILGAFRQVFSERVWDSAQILLMGSILVGVDGEQNSAGVVGRRLLRRRGNVDHRRRRDVGATTGETHQSQERISRCGQVEPETYSL